MDNEKFQELVLNHLANLTQEVTELKDGQQRFECRMDKFESKMDKIESRMDNLESKMDKIESRMGNFESRMDKLESKIDSVQVQTAKLTEDVAVLSTRMEHGFSDVVEVQKSLLEMYGEHEAKIRTLQRMPV